MTIELAGFFSGIIIYTDILCY